MKFENGYGGIVKNGGNRRKPFQVRKTIGYDDNGKQLYKTIGWYKTRTEAFNALVEYNKNPYDLEKQTTFKELYDQWSQKHYKDINISTINGYKNSIRYCKSVYDKKVPDIKIMELQEIIDNCPKYSAKLQIRVLLNMLYKYAAKMGIVGQEYNKLSLEVGKAVRVHRKNPFSNEEIQKMFDSVGKIKNIESVLMLCFSGARIRELLEIETKNVHITNGDRYAIGGEKTEAGKNRVIPISNKTLKFFEQYYNSDNKYLITLEGKPVTYATYIRKIWNPIMEELEMDHTPHECRHFCVTSLDKAGVPRRITKRIVGHIDYNSGDVTDIYSHTSIEELVEAIDKI